jgi:cation diffusion facilitator family transporter
MHTYRDQLNQSRRAVLTGIFGSSALALMKIIAGIVGQSHGMVADGIESASDSVAGLIVISGLAVSAKPPDDEHPYGHTRAEDVAGKTVSTLMLVSGVLLLWTHGHGLYNQLVKGEPATTPHSWTFWLMLISLAVKGALFVYKLGVGKRLRSVALTVDAWNDFADVISAAAVLIGLFLARYGISWADRVSALVVAVIILYTAHRVSQAASDALLDQQAPPEVLKELRDTALSVPGVAGVEKLLARRSGLMYFVDMHLEVNGKMPVEDAHQIGHNVKATLQASRPDIADVLIHLEPAPHA